MTVLLPRGNPQNLMIGSRNEIHGQQCLGDFGSVFISSDESDQGSLA
jgi:hypothetical protein